MCKGCHGTEARVEAYSGGMDRLLERINGVVRGRFRGGRYEQVILYIPKPLIPLLIVVETTGLGLVPVRLKMILQCFGPVCVEISITST
jgi:hypothetical protein